MRTGCRLEDKGQQVSTFSALMAGSTFTQDREGFLGV